MITSYVKHLTKIGVNTTQEDIEDDDVPNDHLLRVNHVSVENRTTDYTRLVIGLQNGGDFHQLVEEDAPVADDIYWHDKPFYVPEKWCVKARLMGITANDEIHVFINGYLEKVR